MRFVYQACAIVVDIWRLLQALHCSSSFEWLLWCALVTNFIPFFAVAGELLERLGSEGASLAENLLLRLGEMCAGASDAAEEEGRNEGSNKVALAAQNALGQGIRAMGPQAVLQVLPLGLVEVRAEASFICLYR